MRARLRDESGFGLLELLIAMVILNVGLFALVGAFNGATVAIARAGTVSSATAVVDKQMEIYRSLANCAIWLDTTSANPTNTFPAKDTGTLYQGDTSAYGGVTFLDKAANGTTQGILPWATSATSEVLNAPWYGNEPEDIRTSCIPVPPVSPATVLSSTTTPPDTAVKAIQTLAGPDGSSFLVYTYITIRQPSGSSTNSWEKRVTIVVRDPTNNARILARQTSDFAPSEAVGSVG